MLILSPFAGRLVDRRGSLAFIVAGSLAAIVAGLLYPFLREPLLSLPIIVFESTGAAVLSPALFAIVAAGSPLGRSSTAQGVYGAAGTVGFIISSVFAGQLAAMDLRYPFWMFSAVMTAALVIGLAIGWRRIVAVRPARQGRPVGGGIPLDAATPASGGHDGSVADNGSAQ